MPADLCRPRQSGQISAGLVRRPSGDEARAAARSRRVRFRGAIGFAFACLLLGHPALAAETVRLQFDWLPSGEKAAFYLGVEKGVFAAEGLDIVILPGRGTADA